MRCYNYFRLLNQARSVQCLAGVLPVSTVDDRVSMVWEDHAWHTLWQPCPTHVQQSSMHLLVRVRIAFATTSDISFVKVQQNDRNQADVQAAGEGPTLEAPPCHPRFGWLWQLMSWPWAMATHEP